MNTNQLLKSLELELVTPGVRGNPQRLNELLADDFQEVGSSGKIYRKQEVIELLSGDNSTGYSLSDFQFTSLASNCVLVRYEARVSEARSRRSSVWVQASGRWQLLYHQATPVL